MDNIKERTYLPTPELLTRASCKKKKKTGKGSLNRPSCPLPQTTHSVRDGTELTSVEGCYYPTVFLSSSSSLYKTGFTWNIVGSAASLFSR